MAARRVRSDPALKWPAFIGCWARSLLGQVPRRAEPLYRRFCSAILFPPIRTVLGFFWVGGAIGLGSGAAGLLAESMKPMAPLLLAIGALFGYWSFVRIVERRPVVELLSPGSPGEAAIGVAIGVGLFSAVIGILFLLGGYSATVAKTTPDVMPVLMAAAYMVTRRNWLPVGVHVAWNFNQSGIFGVPTSGVDSAGYLEGRLHGSALLSGGSFGPEASIAAVAVCLAIGFYFLVLASTKGHILRPSWRRQLPMESGS